MRLLLSLCVLIFCIQDSCKKVRPHSQVVTVLLGSDRTGVDSLAWSSVCSRYVIGLISRVNTGDSPVSSLNCDLQ